MMTITPDLLDQRVGVTFAAQGNSPTRWIEINYPADNPPTALLEALNKIGFKQDERMASFPPVSVYAWDYTDPDHPRYVDQGHKEYQVELYKRGTGLFRDWTDEEARTNMSQARAVMRRFGLTRVPVWKKTLADML